MNNQKNLHTDSQGAYQEYAPVSNYTNINNNQVYQNNVVQNTNANNNQAYQNNVVQNVSVNNNQVYQNNVVQNVNVNNNQVYQNNDVQNPTVNGFVNFNVTSNGQFNGVNNNMSSNVKNVNNIMKSLDNNVYEEKTKSKVGKLLFVLLIFVIIAVGYFAFFRNTTSNANLNVVFDVDKPILVFNNDKKCGYFDYSGEQIIDFKYANGTQFYNGFAGVVFNDEQEEYAIIDLAGNEIVRKSGGEKPQYLLDYDIWVIGDAFYNNKIKLLSPSNYSVKYLDNGLFIFKDFEKNETGIINYECEVLYSMYGTEGVDIEISYSTYDVEELFLKVTTPDSVVVVSTLTDDLVYTHEEESELYAHENGFFYTLNSNGTRDFKYFHSGRFVFYWSGIDSANVADYTKQIVFAEINGTYRYYDIYNDYQLSEPPEKNEYFEFLNGNNNYDYKIYECGLGKGLKKKDNIILECGYSEINFLNINLFEFLKVKKFKEIVLLDDYSSIIIYDLVKKKAISSFKMTNYEFYDDSILIKIEKEDKSGYIIYNLFEDTFVEINGENIVVDIYSNYYTVLNRNKRMYYNADFEMIYELEIN